MIFDTRTKRRYLAGTALIAILVILNAFVVSRIFGGSGFWLTQPDQVNIPDEPMKTIFTLEMLGGTLAFAVLIACLLVVTGDGVRAWIKAGK